MVRAGVVDHPGKWKWSGYHEIQKPKTRYRLIDHDKLCKFLNSDTHEDLAQTHRRWIESQLKTGPVRQEHFGRSIAVGSEDFVRRIQKTLTSRAVGRRVRETPAAGYQLKETTAEYQGANPDQTAAENSEMHVTNAIPWKWKDALEW